MSLSKRFSFWLTPDELPLTAKTDGRLAWGAAEGADSTGAFTVHVRGLSSGDSNDARVIMERHWYGKPKEPSGAANDAPARFGPPKYKNAKFQLESPTLTLTINVK